MAKRLPPRPLYTHPTMTVLDAARERMKWLYNEFDGNVTVSCSGGKDSTTVLELAIEAARETGHLPVRIYWLDQECEFQATEDYIKRIAARPEVEFHWFQVPFIIDNSASSDEHWFHVWDPSLDNDTWARPKQDPNDPEHVANGTRIYHSNIYDQDNFYCLLSALGNKHFTGALVDGMRAEESPARRLSMSSHAAYKWTVWSTRDGDPNDKTKDKKQQRHLFRFHPIFDWSYRDVWKAMYDFDWDHNTIYNAMFQYGLGILDMRVSSYTHENALKTLGWLQEVEPETWDRANRRVKGINSYSHLHKEMFFNQYPSMFSSWPEYAEHLMANLPSTPEDVEVYYRQWLRLLRSGMDQVTAAQWMCHQVLSGDLYGTRINSILVNQRLERRVEKMEFTA